MRLSILSTTVASAALPVAAFRVYLTYNTIYDQGERPLSEVACWDPKVPGLFPGYNDWLLQRNIPVGVLAIPNITGWDHPDCISCWMVTWEEGARTRMLLAIDGSEKGFVTSLRSMNSLTDGQAKDFNPLEPLEVNASRVSLQNCGFAPRDVRKEISDEL
ncbi:heat-stable antigen [Colletotrichum liriopes]|uniref:Heat-stable antigen n=1 Tax=Colletotrichum liriopes TaxID=708192 RepID=A0AA37H2X3_9PEZI|nr:heat-stable antigen [Colletotrichum liriopes]